jgi:hypothetical protein
MSHRLEPVGVVIPKKNRDKKKYCPLGPTNTFACHDVLSSQEGSSFIKRFATPQAENPPVEFFMYLLPPTAVVAPVVVPVITQAMIAVRTVIGVAVID